MKRKRAPVQKKKPKKKKLVVSDSDDSEDSDFETKDRKKRHMAKGEVSRQTRGVSLNYQWDENEKEYSDDDD